MVTVHQFECLSDNYGYLIHDSKSGETVALDTPDASKYLAEAQMQGWSITQIWNTHWHPDHSGGNKRIKEQTGCRITGPKKEISKIPSIDNPVGGGDTVSLGDYTAHVIDVPGHTLGHIAFYLPEVNTVFVGDALFALGCGRLFEGTPEMMWQSLSRLKALPPDTTVYCAHEYTLANAEFAITIDPDNLDLTRYVEDVRSLRTEGKRTVPTTIAKELASNPFLRADISSLQERMGYAGDQVATFAEIRRRKDRF